MITWTCGQCGLQAPVNQDVGPVTCSCGYVDQHPIGPEYIRKVNDSRPATGRRLSTYSRAIVKWRQAGYPIATDYQVKDRFSFCQPCDYFNGQICTHVQCGCNIQIEDSDGAIMKLAGLLGIKSLTEKAKAMTNKLRMATESCPVGKWGAVESRPP